MRAQCGRGIRARVAPPILQMSAERDGTGVAAHQPRSADHHLIRRPRHDRELIDAGPGHPGRTQRVDEQMHLERVLDKGLHTGARTTESTVPQSDFDHVAGPEVAVDRVDEQRFLERPLPALDVVPDGQLLHGGRAGFGRASHERPADQLRAGVVAPGGISGLQVPVGVVAEAQLEPAAVRDTRAADRVGEHDLLHGSGDHRRV